MILFLLFLLFILSMWYDLAAPEIYGHEDVKKALLLQLVGGSSRYTYTYICAYIYSYIS